MFDIANLHSGLTTTIFLYLPHYAKLISRGMRRIYHLKICVGPLCAPSKSSPGQSLVRKSTRGRGSDKTGGRHVRAHPPIPLCTLLPWSTPQRTNACLRFFPKYSCISVGHGGDAAMLLTRDPGHAWGPCNHVHLPTLWPQPQQTPLLSAQGSMSGRFY